MYSFSRGKVSPRFRNRDLCRLLPGPKEKRSKKREASPALAARELALSSDK